MLATRGLLWVGTNVGVVSISLIEIVLHQYGWGVLFVWNTTVRMTGEAPHT